MKNLPKSQHRLPEAPHEFHNRMWYFAQDRALFEAERLEEHGPASEHDDEEGEIQFDAALDIQYDAFACVSRTRLPCSCLGSDGAFDSRYGR